MNTKISLKRISVATITGSIVMLVLVPLLAGAAPSAVPTLGNVDASFYTVRINNGVTDNLLLNSTGFISSPSGIVVVQDTGGLYVADENANSKAISLNANGISVAPFNGAHVLTYPVLINDPDGFEVQNGAGSSIFRIAKTTLGAWEKWGLSDPAVLEPLKVRDDDGLSIQGNGFYSDSLLLSYTGKITAVPMDTGFPPALNFSSRRGMVLTDETDTQVFKVDDEGIISNPSTKNGGDVKIGDKLDVEVSAGGAATIGSRFNEAIGLYSVAMGYDTHATGDYATAMGNASIASGNYSVAMGYGATASGSVAIALGDSTLANGWNSTAIGYWSEASGDYSLATGMETTASGYESTAMGNWSTASGDYSTAIGNNVTAETQGSFVIGKYNVLSGGDPNGWEPTEPLFIIGNGTGAASRSNAVTVLKNGNVGISTTDPTLGGKVGSKITVVTTGTAFAAGTSNTQPSFAINPRTNGSWASYDYVGGSWKEGIVQYNGRLGLGLLSTDASPTHKLEMRGDMYVVSGKIGVGVSAPTAQLEAEGGTVGVMGKGSLYGGYFEDSNDSGKATLGWTNTGIQAGGSYSGGYFYDTDTADVGVTLAFGGSDKSINAEGKINVDENGIAMTVMDDEAIWYNGTYFSWGYDSSWNYFERNVGIGKLFPYYQLELPDIAGIDGRGRANAWNTYSDTRVKENQVPLLYGLKEVMALNPKSYNHHSSHFDGNKLVVEEAYGTEIGLIAQEVYDVIPEAVGKPTDENTELWSLDYDKFAPVLVKAIQELKAEKDADVAALKAETEALRAEVAVLKAQVEELKSLFAN